MRVVHLNPSSYRQMPWKNGLGITTEIARRPVEGEIDWRVSVARVAADGPFSKFPGCDRVIVALDGAGMTLTHHETGAVAALARLEPWSFSGDWTTSCVLREGAIRDFNVITRRAAVAAEVAVLLLDGLRSIDLSAATTLLYCVSGSAVTGSELTIPMAPDDTVIVERAPVLTECLPIRPSGEHATVIRVDIHPISPKRPLW